MKILSLCVTFAKQITLFRNLIFILILNFWNLLTANNPLLRNVICLNFKYLDIQTKVLCYFFMCTYRFVPVALGFMYYIWVCLILASQKGSRYAGQTTVATLSPLWPFYIYIPCSICGFLGVRVYLNLTMQHNG